MKILHTVEFYEPYKGGSEEVVKQISENFVKFGHDVTVATSYHPERNSNIINGVKIEQFQIKGNEVKGFKGEIERYQQFLLQNDFDIIWNYAAQTWTTDLTFRIINKLKAKLFFSPVGYSKLNNNKYKTYYEKLPSILQKYDKIFYTSPNFRDKYFGDQYGLTSKAIIIPNGANKDEFINNKIDFRKKYKIQTKYLFITVSNHYFAKGHKFIIDAIEKIETNDFTFVIIGERPYAHKWYSCYPYCKFKSLINKHIMVLSNIPRTDVVSAYNSADLFLFGSKVECAPLVMYESFASRTPFITRNVGNIPDHKEHLWIINSPEEMASHINNYIKDATQYKMRSNDAYNSFEKLYDWKILSKLYEQVYILALKV